MERSDYEYMANVLNDKKWWHSDDRCIFVARSLVDERILREPDNVIDFLEKPSHFEQEMVEYLNEYEEYYMKQPQDYKCPLCEFTATNSK